MTAFDIWPDFGFSRNPYSQETLPPTEEGSTLLAGRVEALQNVQKRIGSSGAFLSVEGPIGAGKTSLLNVAIYKMYQATRTEGRAELWVPATKSFQPREDADEFEADLYRTLLQTIIRYKDDFWKAGLKTPDPAALDKWLNSPAYKNWSGSAGSFGVGQGQEPNSSEGFLKSGLPQAVNDLLAEIYGENGTGGIVCVLDNLEIVGQVGLARDRLDELRDRVFNIPHVHWVLCGSRGMVSRARTQRLSGTFAAAFPLLPLTEDEAIEAIKRRVQHFGTSTALPPLTPEGFRFLYRALNKNLRDAMTWAQQFSHWLHEEYPSLNFPAPDDRDDFAQAWLGEQAELASKEARTAQPRQWTLFRDLCASGGQAGSSEYEKYGFQKQQQFVEAVRVFVAANLMAREVDPEDGSRTINSVTASGWLVYFFQNNLELPAPSGAI
ncbi:hypothetical protein [Rathayibacter rathayi]|uniref:hypothetical protein n=1 Tax=Rathayibacter rathayi TaxID=33887 RepID=UPI001054F4AD|nr:hypothetical protein [Rathayibacter rathayi]MWV76023.1 hypothetical protein [Rathayibacter rathayi NCPPB 2980 = VKM Ac-1601]